MNRRRWCAAAVAFVAVGAAPAAALLGDHPLAQVPLPTVIDAFAVLSESSAPLPFADDPPLTADWWTHPGDCAALMGAYQADGAPVPAGATFTAGPRGSLVVDAPYGPSAIFTQDDPTKGRCIYAIHREQTVVISAAGIGAVDTLLPVLCISSVFGTIVATEFDPGGGTWTVVAVQQGDPSAPTWMATLRPGPLEAGVDAENLPPGSVQTTGTATYEDGVLVFDGTIDQGSVSLRLTCTPFLLPTQG